MKIRFPYFLIVILILIGIDFYAFQAFKVISETWRPGSKRILFIVYWSISVMAVSTIISMSLSDFTHWPRPLRVYMLASLFTLYITKLVLIPFMLSDDLIRLVKWISMRISHSANHPQIQESNKISRSEFISYLGLGVAALPFGGLIYGMLYGGYDYNVRRVKLKFANLPPAFDGLTILQISDIHSGSFPSTKPLETVAKIINKQKADIIFFTGDLVNNETDEVNEHLPALNKWEAPMGIYSILGNHDYGDYKHWDSPKEKEENMNRMVQVHQKLGWELLRNEHRVIERNGQKIAIAGVENWGALRNFPKYGDLDKALAGTNDLPFTILLSHDPTHWDAKVLHHHHPIDLMLAGHTHGMQFGIDTKWFKWSPAQYIYKQWAGLYKEGKKYLYVNRGLGFLGYPGRAGIRPEITVIELKRA